MWKAKCCQNDNPLSLMKNSVELFYKERKSFIQDGRQLTTYAPASSFKKLCHIKDRSQVAQDTAITNGIKNLDNSKELIFSYFDVKNFEFNEVKWSNTRFKVLGVNKISSITMNGKRFNALDELPFISILIGLAEL